MLRLVEALALYYCDFTICVCGFSSSEDDMCPDDKIVRPHPQSFLSSLNKNAHNPIKPVNRHTGIVKSFIARNSPMKPSQKVSHFTLWV